MISAWGVDHGEVSKSFYKGKAIPVTQMHIKTRRALKHELGTKKDYRNQLKGAKITYTKAGKLRKNGRPVLHSIHAEGPNVKDWGPRQELMRRAKQRGFNTNWHATGITRSFQSHDDIPGGRYTFKRTGS
jgi:hypothetical protein